MDKSKVIGAIIGLAVGDALGVPVEFSSREELKGSPVTGMRGYGVHHQPPGTWSDDTSLTLCLVDSLCSGYDLDDIGQRFCRWLYEGYWTPHGYAFDVGGTTREAISRLAGGIEPRLAGLRDEYSNGNGSLMRILPVAFYFAPAGDPCLRMMSSLRGVPTNRYPTGFSSRSSISSPQDRMYRATTFRNRVA